MTSFYAGSRRKGDRTSVMVTSARKIDENVEVADVYKQPLAFTCEEDGNLSIQVSDAWREKAVENKFNLLYQVNDALPQQIDIEHGDWRNYSPNYILHLDLVKGDIVRLYGQNKEGLGTDLWAAKDVAAGDRYQIPVGKESYQNFNITSGWKELVGGSTVDHAAAGKFRVSGNIVSLYDWDSIRKGNTLDITTYPSADIPSLDSGSVQCAYTPSVAWLFHNEDSTHKIVLTDASDLCTNKNFTGAYCVAGLFYGQTELEHAPKNWATRIAARMAESACEGCTKLLDAPIFHSKVVEHGGLHRAFFGCTSLIYTSPLNFKDVREYACKSMFEGCESLAIAPSLLGYEVMPHAGERMFYGCTSLTSTGMISLETASAASDKELFANCPNIAHVYIPNYNYQPNVTPADAFENWLDGNNVTHGVFECLDGSNWPNSFSGNPWPIKNYEYEEGSFTLATPEPKSVSAVANFTIGNPFPNTIEFAVRLKGAEDWTYVKAKIDETNRKIGQIAPVSATYVSSEKETKTYECFIVLNRDDKKTEVKTETKEAQF